MSDLAWGFAIVAGLAVVLCAIGSYLGRICPVPMAAGIGVATAACLAARIARPGDGLWPAMILPVSNLIVVGNPTTPLTSFLAGLAWSLMPRQKSARPAGRARRLLVVAPLAAVGWAAAVQPVWGEPPRCRDRWEGDFCYQTDDFTCSAACAATLLRSRGIAATEGEMARLCLTRRGTLWLGLYRGLKLKTAGTPWDVEVVRGPVDRLLASSVPAILAAGVPRDARVARVYAERYGWTPGVWHSVLFYGPRGGGRVAMGDPTPGVGREEWTAEDLRVLWDGAGLRLVPRARAPRADGER